MLRLNLKHRTQLRPRLSRRLLGVQRRLAGELSKADATVDRLLLATGTTGVTGLVKSLRAVEAFSAATFRVLTNSLPPRAAPFPSGVTSVSCPHPSALCKEGSVLHRAQSASGGMDARGPV